MEKVIRIGKSEEGHVFCKITISDKQIHVQGEYCETKPVLSISGVVGPMPNGDCKGSCGQILDSFSITKFAPDWGVNTLGKFLDIWKKYHLNDMQAGCIHQQKNDNNECGDKCPTCGYSYGSAWLYKEIPQGYIDFLNALPETDLRPAWV